MSYNQKEVKLIPTGPIWQFFVDVTQVVGAPTPMGFLVEIPEGERGLFLGGRVNKNNYGAARDITVALDVTGSSASVYTIGVDGIDNQEITLGHTLSNLTEVASTIGVIGLPNMPFLMTEKSELKFSGASMANAEVLGATFWIATRILPPIITPFGAGVTVTTETLKQV